MLIPQDTLVLVGDGRRALFLRNKGGAGHPDLITAGSMYAAGPDGKSRSATQETDWHQQAEDRFAAEIAELLYKKAHGHEFEKLIVVAPPRTLGVMRSAFRKEVAAKVSAEVAKDLTSHDLRDIARLLKEEPSDKEW